MNRAPLPSPASPRPRAVAARALGLAALAASACSLSQNGVTPPADTFFFPTGAIMNPTDTAGQWLYVANSNADLRFNDGTLVMVNVGDSEFPDPAQLDGTLHGAALDRANPESWGACPQEDYVNPLPRSDAPICCRDLLDPIIINCDERRYVAADATVSIGSFAAGMVWQPFCNLSDGSYTNPCSSEVCQPGENPGRLLIGVRGDTSLTDVDVAPVGHYKNPSAVHPAFHCTADGLTPTLGECDQKIQDTSSALTVLSGDQAAGSVQLPDEPYALALDPARGYLYVGHLVGSTSVQNSGGLSLFDASGTSLASEPEFPLPPSFIAPFGSPFPANSSGLFGVTNLHMHQSLGNSPNSGQNIFASSRYVPLASSMTVIGPQICQPGSTAEQDDVLVPAGDTLNPGLAGAEVRGVEFIEPPAQSYAQLPDYASRVFALQRTPPALVGFDIAKNASGATTVTPTDVMETCSSPTFLYQNDSGDGPRLFVNCFDTGEVYVFDPAGPSLVTTLIVARGPAGMIFDATRPVAYVLSFTQNNVVVVDLAPGSPTQYHVLQRLGFPTLTPR